MPRPKSLPEAWGDQLPTNLSPVDFVRIHGPQPKVHLIREAKIRYTPDTSGPAIFNPDTILAHSSDDIIWALAELKMGGGVRPVP